MYRVRDGRTDGRTDGQKRRLLPPSLRSGGILKPYTCDRAGDTSVFEPVLIGSWLRVDVVFEQVVLREV